MNNLSNDRKPYEITFSSLSEAWDFAVKISKSSLIPVAFRGKPDDILLIIQLGAEVGLKPMQALQGISVINFGRSNENGKPTMGVDALLAICRNHPDFVSIEESYDEKTMTATCAITRKNQPVIISKFSMADAKRANLVSRPIWQTYPERMLKIRARGFAIRDAFADAIKGLMPKEEVEDYQDIQEKKVNKNEVNEVESPCIETFKDDYQISEDELNILEKEAPEVKEVKKEKKERKTKKQEKEIIDIAQSNNRELDLKAYYLDKHVDIDNATTIQELKNIYDDVKAQCNNDPNIMMEFQAKCHARKNHIMNMEEEQMNNHLNDIDNEIK